MQKWAAVTCLNFVKQDTTSGIEIQFAKGEYGTGFPFDGQGGEVARSYPPYTGLSDPGQGGDIDIDDDEVFVDGCSTVASKFVKNCFIKKTTVEQ